MSDPVVTIVTSLPPASASTPIVVTVVGTNGVGLRRAWASVAFPGIIGDEVIHNSNRFGAYYSNPTNTRTSVTDGYQFTFLRDGGWPVGSFPLATSFTINAVDTVGNGAGGGGTVTNTVALTNANVGSLVICTPVYSSGAGACDGAQGDTEAHARCIGLIQATVGSGLTATVQTGDTFTATTAQWDAVTGGSGGLTPSTKYFVHPTIKGQLTSVPPPSTSPWTSAQWAGYVGSSLSTTQLLIDRELPVGT